jgi:hypothetical protein
MTLRSLVGSDGRYDKVARLFDHALPLSEQLAKKTLLPLAPDSDGFHLEQFFKMKACFVHEIALLEGITKDAAQSRLQQSPFLYCASGMHFLTSDETSVRQALTYCKERDLVMGFCHDNATHTFRPVHLSQARSVVGSTLLVDNALCFLLRPAKWPRVPPFLLAVVGTAQKEHGNLALMPVGALADANLLKDLIRAVFDFLGLTILTFGCDGAGRLIVFTTRPSHADHFNVRDVAGLLSNTGFAETYIARLGPEPSDLLASSASRRKPLRARLEGVAFS